MLRATLCVLLISALVPAAPVQRPAYRRLDPNSYQSFVGNWARADMPRCAAIDSAAKWAQVLHPAPVMSRNRPFAPPASFWRREAVLLVARVINAGDTSNVFEMRALTRDKNDIDVAFIFHPTAHASYSIKWWMALAVAKPLPANVRFRENGRLVCDLNPAARNEWMSPLGRRTPSAKVCAGSWYAAGTSLNLVPGSPKIRAVYAIRRVVGRAIRAKPHLGYAYRTADGRVYYIGERTSSATVADRDAEAQMLVRLGVPNKAAGQAASVDLPVAIRRDDLLKRLPQLGYAATPCR